MINMRALDFTRYTNSQQRANIRKMADSCKALTKQLSDQQITFPEFDDFAALVHGLEKPVSSKKSKISLQWMPH